MKIIQVTDVHLVPDKREMHGVNPFDRLSICIKDIELNHQDAELCVISGDLSHKGQIKSYEALAEILTGLSIPYRLMVGNHDIRANLLSVFPDVPTDPNGFIQSFLDIDIGRLIFLDTVAEGEKFGCFCEDRAEWLADHLTTSGERPVYLFLHHPPLDIGLPNIDRMRLLYGDQLLARTLAPFDNVQHMFFGHVHRPTAGNWNGISFSSLRGTAHQVALTLTETPLLVRSHEPPAYGVIFLNTNSTIVHFHDFMNQTAFIADADQTSQPSTKGNALV
jgi:3',5'-cyclic AMP phosphodiesterase CpdA